MVQKSEFQVDKTEFPVDGIDRTYYIEIQYDTSNGTAENRQKDKFDSGLSDGDDFPVICDG